MKTRSLIAHAAILIFLTLPLASSPSVSAQSGGPYHLVWWSVGSGSKLIGGDYSMAGVFGQPDAGQHKGGNFALTGGFWGTSDGFSQPPDKTPELPPVETPVENPNVPPEETPEAPVVPDEKSTLQLPLVQR